jgi:CDP-6-deoxy-D-xylo-4-hexulose-3-dehydrase
VAQLSKLDHFNQIRRRNFDLLYSGLADLEEFFILPQALPNSQPSWFGFPLAVRPNAPFTRDTVLRHLEKARIGTRLLFGGNLTRQPAYLGPPHRKIGNLENSDFVMNNVFWIGVYPALTEPMIQYVIDVLHQIPGLKA